MSSPSRTPGRGVNNMNVSKRDRVLRTKENGDPILDIKLFKSERNIEIALELMKLDAYKPIVAVFGADKLHEARFGITATAKAFDFVMEPLEYYAEGGRHETDGGKTPFQKEIYRNWSYVGYMEDRRIVRNGKADHWYLVDYQLKDPFFKCPVPAFRLKQLDILSRTHVKKLKAHIESIRERSEALIKPVFWGDAKRYHCYECNGVARPNPVSFTKEGDSPKRRWAHYACVFRRTLYHEENYLMEIPRYRPKKKEQKTFSLQINNSNFPTVEEYAVILSISKRCEQCKHYYFKKVFDEHECNSAPFDLIVEDCVKERQYKRKFKELQKSKANSVQRRETEGSEQPKIPLEYESEEDEPSERQMETGLPDSDEETEIGENTSNSDVKPPEPDVTVEAVDSGPPAQNTRRRSLRTNLYGTPSQESTEPSQEPAGTPIEKEMETQSNTQLIAGVERYHNALKAELKESERKNKELNEEKNSLIRKIEEKKEKIRSLRRVIDEMVAQNNQRSEAKNEKIKRLKENIQELEKEVKIKEKETQKLRVALKEIRIKTTPLKDSSNPTEDESSEENSKAEAKTTKRAPDGRQSPTKKRRVQKPGNENSKKPRKETSTEARGSDFGLEEGI